MFKLFKLVLLSILLTPQFTVADAKLTHSEAISNLMTLSGLAVQVPQISNSLIISFDPFVYKSPKEIKSKLSRAISASFDKKIMLSIINDEVAKNVSLKDSLSMLEWYKSDIGKEITKAEEIATNEVNVEELFTQKAELMNDKERVALCTQIEEKSHIIDFLVDSQIEVMKSTLAITQPTKNNKSQDEYFDTLKVEVKKSIKEQTILSLLKSYESIETEKMRKYAKFLSQPATERFITSGYRGVGKAIIGGTNELLTAIMAFSK